MLEVRQIGGDVMLADNVRALRNAKEWMQEDLAAKSGVRLGTISRIENGGGTTTATLEKLAGALGVTVAELFSNSETAVKHDNVAS